MKKYLMFTIIKYGVIINSMAKKFLFLVLFFALIFHLLSLFNTNSCYAAAAKAGQIIFIEGSVQVKRSGTNAWNKAEEFDPLYNNDEIRTLKNSTAEIEFTHGDIVLISSSSHFKIQNYSVNKKQRIGEFFLSLGKTWVNVKKAKGKGSKFKINTPAGAASVRGTLFVVEVLPKELTKPPTPENLQISIAVVNGKIDVDTPFDKKVLNPLKEVNFTKKDQQLIIQNIKPAYLNEAQKIIKIINELQNKILKKEKKGELIDEDKVKEKKKVNIIDNTNIGLVQPRDSDSDGLSNALEMLLGSNPDSPDTDGDLMTDKQEFDHGLNLLVDDALGDLDSDGIGNRAELQLGLNPNLAADAQLDPDDDNLPNVLEVSNGSDINVANPDIDQDNISNAFEVARQNLGFPMNPYTKSQFSDKVDQNYRTINSNYPDGHAKKINFAGITDEILGDAATIGDGISDADEIQQSNAIKVPYNITSPRLSLDPTYYNLPALINRISEYQTIVNQQGWNDFEAYTYDINGNFVGPGDALPSLSTLYNPKNWNLLLIINLSKKIILLDGSFSLPMFSNLQNQLTDPNEDIGGLLFGIYKIMDPDGDYIRNADEEFASNSWLRLNPLVEDKIGDYVNSITMDNPIFIISLNNSLSAPFTGQLILSNSNQLTTYPHALLASNLEFDDPITGLKKLCPGNVPMLKYPVPGQSNQFIYICPRDPLNIGDVFPPGG